MQPHLETPQLKLRIIHDYPMAKGTRRHLNFTGHKKQSHGTSYYIWRRKQKQLGGGGGQKTEAAGEKENTPLKS